MSEWENRERTGDQPRAILGKERRSYSSAVRGGERGPARVAENGRGREEWSVVRSRKRKASQPEAGIRDKFRDAERFDNTGNGLEVRQSRVRFTGLHRSLQGTVDATSSQGITSKRASS